MAQSLAGVGFEAHVREVGMHLAVKGEEQSWVWEGTGR